MREELCRCGIRIGRAGVLSGGKGGLIKLLFPNCLQDCKA